MPQILRCECPGAGARKPPRPQAGLRDVSFLAFALLSTPPHPVHPHCCSLTMSTHKGSGSSWPRISPAAPWPLEPCCQPALSLRTQCQIPVKRTFQVQLILSSSLTGQKPLADLPSATLPSCHLVQSVGQGRVLPKQQEVGRADAPPAPGGRG